MKINVTIDDKNINTNLKNNQTLIFTKRAFFCTLLGFTQSYSGTLGDIGGYIKLNPGTYKSDKPIDITSVDKVLLKCDCINGSIVNGIREPILYRFALDQPPGYKI